MSGLRRVPPHTPSLRAQRSNPDCRRGKILDCFAALAMTMRKRLDTLATSSCPGAHIFKRRRIVSQIPHQLGFEVAGDRVLDLAARDADVAERAVVELAQRLDGAAALQAVEQGIGGSDERGNKSAR